MKVVWEDLGGRRRQRGAGQVGRNYGGRWRSCRGRWSPPRKSAPSRTRRRSQDGHIRRRREAAAVQEHAAKSAQEAQRELPRSHHYQEISNLQEAWVLETWLSSIKRCWLG